MQALTITRSTLCTLLLSLATFPANGQSPTVTLTPGMDVQAAVNSNSENTTFVFPPGVYRLQSIQPKNGDSFIGQSNPLLSGAETLTTFNTLGNLYFVDGQTQQGQQNGYCDPQHPACVHPEDLFFDSVPLLHVTSLSAVVSGSWFFDYPNHRIYFADNPYGHLVETSVTRSAFSGGAANVTITGFTIEKYAVPAQFGAVGDQYPGPNWTVSQNEIRWNHGAGINLIDGSQALQNFVHHNGQKGIGASGGGVLIQGNEVSFNNWAGFTCSWECGGIKVVQTNFLVVRGNSIHDNLGGGLWGDLDNIYTLYENNTIIGNLAGGIQHEISYSAIIRYNTVCNNSIPGPTDWLWGSQITILNSQDVQVYGNTVQTPVSNSVSSGNGIGVIQQNRGSGAYGPHVSQWNVIQNNTIIYQGGVTASGAVADYDAQNFLQNGSNLFDYNNYHLADPGWYHWAWGNGLTLSGFQQLGQELHGTADAIFPTTRCPLSGTSQ